ncbi:MAG: hypothetical protein EOO42_01225 [Flavobacteriales bacterium]|nr:MAG: hypothetical protein EOO42_01225 [Flavobacteriales bacterium]
MAGENENTSIDQIPNATTTAGAMLLGTDNTGKTRQFPITTIQNQSKGLAFAGTVPGVAVPGDLYDAKAGVTYTNFLDVANNSITIPSDVGGNKVLSATLRAVDSTHWVAIYNPVPIDLTDYAKADELATTGKNLYNIAAAQSGKDIDNTTGAIVSGSDDVVIIDDVEGEMTYKYGFIGSPQSFRIAYFSTANSLLKIEDLGTADTIKTPSGTYRLVVRAPASSTNRQVEKGSVKTSFEPFKYGVKKPITINEFTRSNKNLYNPATVLKNKDIDAGNGSIVSGANDVQITKGLKGNSKYTLSFDDSGSGYVRMSFLTALGAFLSSIEFAMGTTFATPANTYEARYTNTTTSTNRMLQEGSLFTPYVEFTNDLLPQLVVKDDLDSIVYRLQGKKVQFSGDSMVSDAYNYFQKMVARQLKCITINDGVGGACFVPGYEGLPRKASVTERIMNTVAANLPDVLFIEGLFNDWSNSVPIGSSSDLLIPVISGGQIVSATGKTVYGCINYLCQQLGNSYPAMEIYFITPHQWGDDEGNRASQLAYATAFINGFAYYGKEGADMFNRSGINYRNINLYTEDKTHINATKGAEAWAKQIVRILR